MKTIFRLDVLLTLMLALLFTVTALLSSCSAVKPQVQPLTPLTVGYNVDSLNRVVNPFYAPVEICDPLVTKLLVPYGLTPRQQRKYLRVASRAHARVVRAQKLDVPLVSVVKVKDKSDNRGSHGGSYAPRAKAPVASGGSTATQTKTKTSAGTGWLWWLVVGGVAWMLYRAHATR